jgi:hypothetical protein
MSPYVRNLVGLEGRALSICPCCNSQGGGLRPHKTSPKTFRGALSIKLLIFTVTSKPHGNQDQVLPTGSQRCMSPIGLFHKAIAARCSLHGMRACGNKGIPGGGEGSFHSEPSKYREYFICISVFGGRMLQTKDFQVVRTSQLNCQQFCFNSRCSGKYTTCMSHIITQHDILCPH